MSIKYTVPIGTEVREDGYLISKDVEIFDFAAGLNVETDTDAEGYCKATVTGSDAFVNSGTFFTFFDNETASNKWYNFASARIVSNMTRAIFPFSSVLTAVTFTNEEPDSDIDIELYKNGITISERVAIFPVRDSQCAWWTSNLDGYSFDPGDKLAVYARSAGGGSTKPQATVITITFRVTDDVPGDGYA